MATFGVINNNGNCTPVSSTLRGAKVYATRNGYNWIGQISEISWTVFNTHKKVNNKWQPLNFEL